MVCSKNGREENFPEFGAKPQTPKAEAAGKEAGCNGFISFL
jgi:hypothetical protein